LADRREGFDMIVDFNDNSITGSVTTDLCIIGSGAAGISMAREFVGTGVNVLVLEAGGSSFEQKSQEPYQSQIAGLAHEGIHSGRARVLGGTTTLWAGQALPLFDIDFSRRDWISNSGWPITRNDLAAYYPRAQRVMQVPEVSYDQETWPNEQSRPPSYNANAMVTYFSQFTHVPDFARKYREDLAAVSNITLLTHANVMSLKAGDNADRVTQVRIKSFSGKQGVIRARMFVVACGGIESARLLLASDCVEPAGIGNRHDVVGRYFQDHPGLAIPIRPLNRRLFESWYNSFRVGRIRHAVKLAASEQLQRSNRILHVGAEVFYPPEEHDPLAAAKLVLNAVRKKHLLSQVPGALLLMGKRPHKVFKAAFRRFVLKQPASVNSGQPHLGFGVEQMPNPSSRITLSDQVDSLGMRRSVLDWRVTGEEGRAIDIFAGALLKEWTRLGVAEFDPADLKLRGRERGENGGYIDASHHMGTTRMGSDPRTSVVDSSCRVHGYENLYIASSSVFPTGGFSNPTLTMLALCIRMCDELKLRLAGSRDESISHGGLTAIAAAASG
jgi:choline dehydrogenase-like flavoprotein